MTHLLKSAFLPLALVALQVLASPSLAQSSKEPGPKSCAALLSDLGVRTHSFVASAKDASGVLTELSEEIRILSSRDQKGFAVLSKELTRTHAEFENNFQVRNPETGMYDRFVPVRVNPVPAVLPKAQFDKLVLSTQPLLQFLRKLLQQVYSGSDWSLRSLGLEEMDPEDANLLIQIMRESIYFEPKLLNPEMKDYPFLPVSGFDGAIGNPSQVDANFFEMNLGTPSGLSNNFLLAESLNSMRVRLSYLSSMARSSRDDTFQILKDVIDSNAQAWTKSKDGISVVVSPGEYNGGHPDVAFIARRTGMPLVRLADMYIDVSGFVRLNLGPDLNHPKVTGVYGRMEESFFLQSNADGIPMIGPQFESNPEIGRRIGVELRAGANYKFIWGSNGQIVDVEKDSDGKPLFQEVWDALGTDPNRAGSQKGSLLQAIHQRRLYFSALGGRLVDDKRLFPIISKFLKNSQPQQLVAEPVRTLERQEYNKFFSQPERFVVKVPDMSGGQGVSFPALMRSSEVLKLLEEVRAKPGKFEIQYMSEITTLPEYNDNGSPVEVATDLRLFVMMDAKGRVRAGPNSLLLRTAAPGELHSNTSKGGGYGIAIVVDSKKEKVKNQGPQYGNTYESKIEVVPARRLEQLSASLAGILQVTRWLTEAPDSEWSLEQKESVLQLSYQMREVMDLLPSSFLRLIPKLRALAQSRVFDPEDGRQFLFELNIQYRFKDQIPEVAEPIFSQYLPEIAFAVTETRRFSGRSGQRWSKVKLRFLENPETVYWWLDGKTRHERQEYAVYEHIDDPILSAVLAEIKAAGGELRLSRIKVTENDRVYYKNDQSPYFWVNYTLPELSSFLRPVIAINVSKEDALEALSHEKGHFNYYIREFQKASRTGLEGLAAAKVAAENTHSDEGSLLSEREAVADEMESQKKFKGDLFAGSMRALEIWEPGYINRVTYPEFWSLKRWLKLKNDGSTDPKVDHMIEDRLSQILDRVTEVKLQLKQIKLNAKTGWQRDKKPNIQKILQTRDVELILFPFGHDDLAKDQTYAHFLVAIERLRIKKGLNHLGLPRR